MLVKEAKKFLGKCKSSACGCNTCKNMCRDRPCWGTPQDAEALLDAGFANKLWLDWWVGGARDGGDVMIISPAAVGSGGERAPSWPTGQPCIMLTKDGMCSVHEIKPTEGRVAVHEGHENYVDKNGVLHESVAMTWNTKKGKEVVERWRAEVTPQ